MMSMWVLNSAKHSPNLISTEHHMEWYYHSLYPVSCLSSHIIILTLFRIKFLQHIPVRVKPSGRSWVAGETVTLRHFQRHWTVGIVTYGNKARFSSGWNKFCLDNNLKKNQTVSFTFFEAIDGLEFVVEFFP